MIQYDRSIATASDCIDAFMKYEDIMNSLLQELMTRISNYTIRDGQTLTSGLVLSLRMIALEGRVLLQARMPTTGA